MQVPLVSLDEMARLAAAHHAAARSALVDAADATSSGASGDSNAILRKLMEAGYRGRALLPIVDAPAVQQAFAAGIGATISTTIGGTLDPQRFAPLADHGEGPPALRWPLPQRVVWRGMVLRDRPPCWRRRTSRSSSAAAR